MNWAYLRTAALLPLAQALGVSLALGALYALRLHLQGGSSRVALRRLLRFAAAALAATFVLASLWDARPTLRGLWGVARGRAVDEYAMGLLRDGGQGFLARNPAKAAYWYRKAALQGLTPAQLALAHLLLAGEGLPPDPAEGLHWALTAAAGGDAEAMLLASNLLRPTDPARAASLDRRALALLLPRARKGDPEAALTLGLLYFRGGGIPANPVEGYAWMLIAVRHGLPPLQKVLVVLQSRALTPPQRAQAAQRADTLLPHPPS